MSQIDVGNIVPLRLQLGDGATSLFPRAYVFNPSGSQITGSPFNLTHVSNGLYQSNDLEMPDLDSITVQYIVFTDSGHTTMADYTLSLDVFTIGATESPPEVFVVGELSGRLEDVSNGLSGNLEE